jgi:tricorn protease
LQGKDGKTRDLLFVGTAFREAVTQRYEAWVERNRRRVTRWSKGRFAYAHIRSMGLPSLDQFERDLFAHAYGKDALVLDVRNNGGGWTTDRILTMFRPKPHAITQWRGSGKGYPTFRRPFYYWSKPVILLCNERSISNAEIFSHAFKNLKLGTLVGMPTYGGVISTRRVRLSDGSLFGVPLRGWWSLPAMQNMENGPAVPDVLVPLTPDDERKGRDPQLQRAVQILSKQSPPKNP